MRICGIAGLAVWLFAVGLLLATEGALAQGVYGRPERAAGDYQVKADQYARARRAFEEEAAPIGTRSSRSGACGSPSAATTSRSSSTIAC